MDKDTKNKAAVIPADATYVTLGMIYSSILKGNKADSFPLTVTATNLLFVAAANSNFIDPIKVTTESILAMSGFSLSALIDYRITSAFLIGYTLIGSEMRQTTAEFLRDNIEHAINYMIPGNDETDVAGGITNNDEL